MHLNHDMRLLKLPDFLQLTVRKLQDSGHERFIAMANILLWTWADRLASVKQQILDHNGDDGLITAGQHERTSPRSPQRLDEFSNSPAENHGQFLLWLKRLV